MTTKLAVVSNKARVPVEIGSRYTRKYVGHMDRDAGTYWEVNAPVQGDMRLLQLALTSHLLDQARARVQQKMLALRPCKPSQKGD